MILKIGEEIKAATITYILQTANACNEFRKYTFYSNFQYMEKE